MKTKLNEKVIAPIKYLRMNRTNVVFAYFFFLNLRYRKYIITSNSTNENNMFKNMLTIAFSDTCVLL